MSIPALVISLSHREDRRTFAAREAQRVGMSVHFIDAIRAEDIPADQASLSGLTKGRIACWASHRKAWEAASLGGSDRVLILEDDVRWLRNPRRLLEEVETWPESSFDILQLGSLHSDTGLALRRVQVAHRVSTIARISARLWPPAAKMESWLVNRSQLLLQSKLSHEAEVYLSEEVKWGFFGAGAHAYILRTAITPRLNQYNWPAFLAADDALSALATQWTFRIGALQRAIATQAHLRSDLR